MDKLEDFIGQNRELFDQTELPSGHKARFLEKLATADLSAENSSPAANSSLAGKSARFGKAAAWLVAASVAAALAFTFFTSFPTEERGESCELNPQIAELRLYYNMQMEDLMMQMKSEMEKRDNPAFAVLITEGKKIQSACEEFDKTIALELPCSDKGIYAFNQQYASSLEGMQILYKQMQYIKNEQSKN